MCHHFLASRVSSEWHFCVWHERDVVELGLGHGHVGVVVLVLDGNFSLIRAVVALWLVVPRDFSHCAVVGVLVWQHVLVPPFSHGFVGVPSFGLRKKSDVPMMMGSFFFVPDSAPMVPPPPPPITSSLCAVWSQYKVYHQLWVLNELFRAVVKSRPPLSILKCGMTGMLNNEMTTKAACGRNCGL